MPEETFNSWSDYLRNLIRRSMDEAPLHLPFRFDLLQGLHLPKAAIASDLSPLVRDQLTEQSVVRIVGYDGFSLTKQDYPWRAELAKWLSQGAEVRYLLQEPLPETSHALQDVRRMAGSKGQIEVRDADENGESGIISHWNTFHFVIVENPNMLWVEECHPHHDTTALRCHFFDATQTPHIPAYPMLREQFDRVYQTESSSLAVV